MSFMQPFIYERGTLLSADCASCGATLYAHEHAQPEAFAAITGAGIECDQCVNGISDLDTVTDCGQQYAGRYSANGYMDCTDWHYNEDEAALRAELDEMYGDDWLGEVDYEPEA